MRGLWRAAPPGWNALWRAFRTPDVPGRREAIHSAWERLPAAVRVPEQALGRQNAGCAATYNVMERCDFACTACYLAERANSTPAMPLGEVKAQLDAIRAFLGPGGNTQITGGEVTLLPVDHLVEILRYCGEIELDAMVMTHGETFRRDPTYLPRLVAEAGLKKVAIHIDSTQRGRAGQPRRPREVDLHGIRDEFADLIRRTRRETGRPLHASHTYTVTESNLDEVPDVLRWTLRNADAFRMISFQPTAEVGRTRERAITGRQDLVWSRIHAGLGQAINARTFHFGHPACNQVALLFVVRFGEGDREELRVVEVAREGMSIDRRFFRRLLSGGLQGYSHDDSGPAQVAFARLLGRLVRDPRYLLEIPAYCAYRAYTSRDWLPRLLGAMARGRPWSIRPFVIVVHNFMSTHELATAEGQDRLAACTFRLPIDGRMVSMCEMNGTELRGALNDRARVRGKERPAVPGTPRPRRARQG